MTNSTTSSQEFPHLADQQLSTHDAFRAMHQFLVAYWERSGKPDDSLINILSWTAFGEDGGPWKEGPADPAMWPDWLDAIEAAKATRRS